MTAPAEAAEVGAGRGPKADLHVLDDVVAVGTRLSPQVEEGQVGGRAPLKAAVSHLQTGDAGARLPGAAGPAFAPLGSVESPFRPMPR